MASGRLASVNPTSLTETVVYTVPASTYAVVTINVYNQGNANTTLDLSIVETSSDSPSLEDYIEYKTVIDPSGQVERTGVVVSAGQTIKALTSGSSVGVQVWGIETEV